MNNKVTAKKVAEYADSVFTIRQHFSFEEVEFLKKTCGISVVQLKVLLSIATQQPCTMGQVAKRMPALSLSSVTVIVDKLVRSGRVRRIRCDEDRRVVRVELTEDGDELYDVYRQSMRNVCEGLLSHLSDKEQNDLVEIYRKLSERITEAERQKEV